jgi:hypothetical protein
VARDALRPYLVVLLLAVLLALALRLRIYENYQTIQHQAQWLLDGLRRLLRSAFWLQAGLLLALSLRQLLRRGSNGISLGQLQLAAGLSSGMTAVNFCSEIVMIYRLHLGSYELLLESLVLYATITLNVLIWYWLVDHPPRHGQHPLGGNRQPGQVSMPYGIVFPEEALERDLLGSDSWTPSFSDYLYFTILSSNCFGPPESHLLVGLPIKRLHTLHSLLMLNLFIVILARAINTLR